MDTTYNTFAAAIAMQADELTAVVPRLRQQLLDLANSGRLTGPGPVLLGIGASHAAAAPAIWHMRERGIPAWLLDPGECPLPLAVGDLPVIAVSQSGRSNETLAAFGTVDPAHRLAVVNVTPSPLSELATDVIGLGSIRDSYASTIGYTATVTALSMLAEAWNGGQIASDWDDIGFVVRSTQQAISADISAATELFRTTPCADFVACASSVGSAEAGALLFREVARIPSTPMSTRQYLHGAMESAGRDVHVLFGGEREAEVARVLSDAGHMAILVTDQDVEVVPDVHVIRIPCVRDTQRGILEAVILQQLAGGVAGILGIPVDEFVFHQDDTKQPMDASVA